mmetsp:Transcript_97598/g.164171  ORF Transcript_97598/g.164171 Transcript_97598/m.164171 type:complete len:263 (+) Transcript_97598:5849-6637(+)
MGPALQRHGVLQLLLSVLQGLDLLLLPGPLLLVLHGHALPLQLLLLKLQLLLLQPHTLQPIVLLSLPAELLALVFSRMLRHIMCHGFGIRWRGGVLLGCRCRFGALLLFVDSVRDPLLFLLNLLPLLLQTLLLQFQHLSLLRHPLRLFRCARLFCLQPLFLLGMVLLHRITVLVDLGLNGRHRLLHVLLGTNHFLLLEVQKVPVCGAVGGINDVLTQRQPLRRTIIGVSILPQHLLQSPAATDQLHSLCTTYGGVAQEQLGQ